VQKQKRRIGERVRKRKKNHSREGTERPQRRERIQKEQKRRKGEFEGIQKGDIDRGKGKRKYKGTRME